jgi:hypothetical protein
VIEHAKVVVGFGIAGIHAESRRKGALREFKLAQSKLRLAKLHQRRCGISYHGEAAELICRRGGIALLQEQAPEIEPRHAHQIAPIALHGLAISLRGELRLARSMISKAEEIPRPWLLRHEVGGARELFNRGRVIAPLEGRVAIDQRTGAGSHAASQKRNARCH